MKNHYVLVCTRCAQHCLSRLVSHTHRKKEKAAQCSSCRCALRFKRVVTVLHQQEAQP